MQAKTLILATGINKSRGIAGETEYLGKGVSYCATCDGMLYRGKNVVVVGENAEGEAEANFLADVCARVTYLPLYQPVMYLKENIHLKEGKPQAVLGENGRVFPRWRWGEKRFPVMGFSLRKTAQPPKVCCLGWKRMARISWLTVR